MFVIIKKNTFGRTDKMVLREGEIFINIPTFLLPVYPNGSFLCSYHTFLHVHEFRRIVTELLKCSTRDWLKKKKRKKKTAYLLLINNCLTCFLSTKFRSTGFAIFIYVYLYWSVVRPPSRPWPIKRPQSSSAKKKKKNQSTERHQTYNNNNNNIKRNIIEKKNTSQSKTCILVWRIVMFHACAVVDAAAPFRVQEIK